MQFQAHNSNPANKLFRGTQQSFRFYQQLGMCAGKQGTMTLLSIGYWWVFTAEIKTRLATHVFLCLRL